MAEAIAAVFVLLFCIAAVIGVAAVAIIWRAFMRYRR